MRHLKDTLAVEQVYYQRGAAWTPINQSSIILRRIKEGVGLTPNWYTVTKIQIHVHVTRNRIQ